MKSIKNNFYYLIFILLWILFAFNTYNVDMDNYKNVFYNIELYDIDYGFKILCLILKNFGADYKLLVLIIATFSLFIILTVIKKYTKNVTFVLLLYLVFPFFLDIIQIRNTLAMAISIYAMTFLIDKVAHYRIKYIVLILIASSIHISAISYLIFLLCDLPKKWFNFIVYISLSFSALIVFMPSILIRFTSIIPKLSYYMISTANTQFITKILFMFILLFLNLILEFKISSSTSNNRLFNFLYKIRFLIFVFYPLLLYDVDFFRIIRNIYLLYYILIANYYDIGNYKIISTKNNLIIIILLVGFVALSNYLFISIYSFNEVIIEILENNEIFGWFL